MRPQITEDLPEDVRYGSHSGNLYASGCRWILVLTVKTLRTARCLQKSRVFFTSDAEIAKDESISGDKLKSRTAFPECFDVHPYKKLRRKMDKGSLMCGLGA